MGGYYNGTSIIEYVMFVLYTLQIRLPKIKPMCLGQLIHVDCRYCNY